MDAAPPRALARIAFAAAAVLLPLLLHAGAGTPAPASATAPAPAPAPALAALPAPDRPASDDKGTIAPLLGEAAADLLLLADTLFEAGRLDDAATALAASTALVPDGPNAPALREKIDTRRLARPRPAPALNTALGSRSLFNGKSLSGWRKTRGKWDTGGNAIACDAGKSEGLLVRSDVPGSWRGLTFSGTIEAEAEACAGIVLGKAGRNRVGVLFDDAGTSLYDFKLKKTLAPTGKRRLPRNRRTPVRITVCGGRVTVKIQGKPALEASLPGWAPGELGLHARGFVRFREPKLIPLEIDACIEKARDARKDRNPGQAASLLLRAEQSLAASGLAAAAPDMERIARAEIAALLAAAFDDLGFRDDARRRAAAFLALCESERSLPAGLKRLRSATARIAGRADSDLADPADRIAHWAEKILDAGETALADTGGKPLADAGSDGNREADRDLDAVVAALTALRSAGGAGGVTGAPFAIDGERTEDFRTRVFLSRCGGKVGRPLFNGADLSGWTKRGGGWVVLEEPERTEGIIGVVTQEAVNILESAPLPSYDRYLLKTRQKGTGNYLDQGVLFSVLGEPWRVRLYRFMETQEITVLRGANSVYYCKPRGRGLTSAEWHDVDFLIHGNRLTLIVDGDPLFTKILPAAPDRTVSLFTTSERRGHFDRLLYRPLGCKGEYRALLAELGVPVREVIECETLKAQLGTPLGEVREQPFAYNGHSLARALDRKNGSEIAYRFRTLALSGAVLSLRYSAVPGRGGPEGAPEGAPAAKLLVTVDGRSPGIPVALPCTGSINDFAYARAELGDLAFGAHTIRLESSAATGRVIVDRLVLSDAAGSPEEETKLHDSPEAPHFRIRLSPGVQLPENSEEIFTLLEEIRDYMIAEYGFEPADPIYYNLISRECWADPHKGGYATGDNIYIPEETTARGLSTIMHELSHNFDRGMGFNPPWFGEGKSFPVFARFKRDHGLRYLKFQRRFSLSAIDSGEAAYNDLEFNGENLLQYWGTRKFPYWGKTPDGRDLTSLGYRSANWLMWELTEYLGSRWLLDYFTLLRREMDEKTWFMPTDRVHANSVLIDAFARSSGKDAVRFFTARRFELRDIYTWRELAADCGGKDETYLTDAGASTATTVEGKKARSVTDGSFTYAFPVAPDVKTLSVTITRGGYGTCHAFGKRLYRGKASGDWETRTYRLRNPELWKSSRLRLTFASEKYGDRTTRIASITLEIPTR